MKSKTLSVQVQRSHCPFCHSAVEFGSAPGLCIDCHAIHHAECLEEHGACAACGSSKRQPTKAVAPRAKAPAVDPYGRVKLTELVLKADQLMESFRFKWWFIFVPHIYIPIFWPFFLLGASNRKGELRRALIEIQQLRKSYGVEPNEREQQIIAEATLWANSGTFTLLVEASSS